MGMTSTSVAQGPLSHQANRRTRWLCAAAALLSLLAITGQASAQQAEPTGKGITGGALLGAETVMITEAIVGVESPWLYFGGAVVGAAGGGVGGYFVEQSAAPRVSFYMLMGGMALLIPTAIVYIDATSVREHEDVVFDKEPEELEDEELDADPPAPGEDVFSQRQAPKRKRPVVRATALVGHGLLGVSPTGLALGVPDVEISPLYTPAEVKELGVPQQTQVLFPLVHGVF